jgi:hypothetical protein
MKLKNNNVVESAMGEENVHFARIARKITVV